MTVALETRYRRQLYDCYLSTHFGPIHHPCAATLERERRVWRDYFGRLLPTDRTACIGDLGCGYGSFLYFLRAEGYTNTRGVDLSIQQVELAGKLGIDNVFHGDCREFLANRPVEFDCLTAIDLLEHLPKDAVLSLLQDIERSLKPGGLLILRAPNADGPFGAKILYSDFTHELAFTPTSIRQVLAAAGFGCVEIHPEGPRVHGVTSAARWIIWKVICWVLVFYVAVETGRPRGHVFTQNLIATARKPLQGNSEWPPLKSSSRVKAHN